MSQTFEQMMNAKYGKGVWNGGLPHGIDSNSIARIREGWNDRQSEIDQLTRERDEARAACVFMRPFIVRPHKDKSGEGWFCDYCGNHDAPWGKDGPGFGFPTTDGKEKHGEDCPMASNPGVPLLAEVEKLRERVKAAEGQHDS